MPKRLPPPPPILSPKESCALFNSMQGAQIRWDKSLNEFVTIDGDRYPAGDVEEIVRHIQEGRAHVPAQPQR